MFAKMLPNHGLTGRFKLLSVKKDFDLCSCKSNANRSLESQNLLIEQLMFKKYWSNHAVTGRLIGFL